MPKKALYRPAISQPCGIGEVGACAYRGGGGGGGVRTPLDFLRNTSHLIACDLTNPVGGIWG